MDSLYLIEDDAGDEGFSALVALYLGKEVHCG